jgi:dTDP-glucose pyrophosphorylase
VPELTGGALETCLAADALVANRLAPLVVMDCDLTFAADAYCRCLAAMADTAGLLLSFRSSAQRYSYAEVEDGRVVRTAEKDPISDHALIGAYGFASADLFFRVARSIVSRDLRVGDGEFYVSSAFNALIAEGLTVRLEDADAYWSFGTLGDLAATVADPAFPAHLRNVGLAIEGGP